MRQPVQESLLTEDEHRLIAMLGDCSDWFARICGDNEKTRPRDINEFNSHLHDLQARVMAQAAARAYPTRYRKGGGIIQNV